MGSLQNQLISISEMDELIGFATRTESVGNHGGVTVSYNTPTADIRAKIRYDSTNEAEAAVKQEKFTIHIKVWVRYDSAYTKFKYVYWDSKYYDIYAIEETPRSRFMVIKARLIEE